MNSRGIDTCTCTHDRSQHVFMRTFGDPVGGEACRNPNCTCKFFFPNPQPDNVMFVPEAVAEWVIVAVHLSTQGVAYFWGPDFSGYVREVDDAGRYTEAEAKSREKWTERMEVAVPLSEVLAVAKLHVCDDYAHRWFHRRFPDGRPGTPACADRIAQESR